VKISVFGLGYVGSVSAACLASMGHNVIGVDVNPVKVDLINSGQSPVIEAGLDAMMAQNVKARRLSADARAADAIAASDLSMICVGTPSADNGDLDLQFVWRVCEQIGRALADKQSYHVVVVRSTMLPGSIEEYVLPTLEKASGRTAGRDFGVVFNPEFLREGSAIDDFYHPPFTLIGQYDERGAQRVVEMYNALDVPVRIVPVKVAEMLKYASNAFHALKVVFANEIGNICQWQAVDSHQVMDIFCMDDKLNLSSAYLKPGFAFGGSCLPKDLRALLYHAHRHDLSVPVLDSILPSNELQIKHGLELIKRTGHKKVGVLGFSFKAGTDDLRESPLVELIEQLIGKGYEMKIYDKNVSLARLHGANRAYIEREIPHIATLMAETMDDVLQSSEVIVIGNKSPEFHSAIKQARDDQRVIDLVGILDGAQTDLVAHYQGISW